MYKLEDLVRNILEDNKSTRNDDQLLYHLYCTKYGCVSDYNFYKVFTDRKYMKDMGLHPYKSVERARRKIQAVDVNLCDEDTKTARLNKEKEYIDYAIK